MSRPSRSRTLLIFYILVGYVSLQFCWWAYLIISLNGEIYDLRLEIVGMEMNDVLSLADKKSELDDKLTKRVWMVLGESFVFLGLLVFGFLRRVRKSFKKEQLLVQQEKNFLASITHELKSPLASVRLVLETLQKREVPTEKKNQLTESAMGQVDRLNHLVENILMATTIENKAFELYAQSSDLSAFLEKLLQNTSNLVPPNTTIVSNITPGITFNFDEGAFSSIVNNLLENAMKYAPSDSPITVSLTQEGAAIILKVADEGIGIPESEHQSVFQRFYRIGNEETRHTKGTGLGLYIVKELTEKHGGKISIGKNSPKGTVFTLKFENG